MNQLEVASIPFHDTLCRSKLHLLENGHHMKPGTTGLVILSFAAKSQFLSFLFIFMFSKSFGYNFFSMFGVHLLCPWLKDIDTMYFFLMIIEDLYDFIF